MSKGYEEESVKEETPENEGKPDQRKTQEAGSKTINPQIVISFIVLFIFAVFAIINTQEVSINFLFTDVTIPLIIVILGSFILGALTTALTAWRSRRKKTRSSETDRT